MSHKNNIRCTSIKLRWLSQTSRSVPGIPLVKPQGNEEMRRRGREPGVYNSKRQGRRRRIPTYLILFGSIFQGQQKVRAFTVLSEAGVLQHAGRRHGFMRNGILTHALSTESFKVNRPYNSSTKILVSFPQAGVSHGELEGLFSVVCSSGG